MRIYIRHAEKAHANGEKNCIYPFDSPLTVTGLEACSGTAEQLHKTFGLPTFIVCSPFLRARQTALAIRDHLFSMTGVHVSILCDNKVGEYLGNHKKIDKQKAFAPQTLALDPIVDACVSHLEVRVREHNDVFGSLDYDNFNFWIVTHGLVIKKLSTFNGHNFEGYPQPLSGLIIGTKVASFGSWKEE